ncbi:MAG TPA: hypothetical protein VFG07_03720 [Thermoplasmata archaeon]|nr:hypothetical protein [Thermoplasmata archaeon]
MAHIEDRGSHFDAPIEIVWKFIQSPDDHGRSHTNRRNLQGEMDGPNGMKTSWEQNVQGNWVNVSNKVTMYPPVAMVIESQEGPLVGSKFLFYYTPKGAKTGIDVVGDFHSKMIPPAQLEQMVLASLEEAFNEDSAAIRKMASKA